VPSARSGTACTLVPPTAPDTAKDADVADPGAVDEAKAAQQASGTGKYGSPPVKPFKPGGSGGSGASGDDSGDAEKKTGWIEVALVDGNGKPVPGEAYSVTLPDGSVAAGTLGADGTARVEGFDPGSCQVTFPNLDGKSWKSA
jgi:hypothetical protein